MSNNARKEARIREKAFAALAEEKWTCWYPKKVRFHATDIFGIADLICCRKNKIQLIQLTTSPNVSSRRKKIMSFLKKFKVALPISIWSWNSKKKIFKKEKVLI